MRHSYPNRDLMTRFVFCIFLYLAFAVQLYAKGNSVQEPSTTYPVGDTSNPVGTPEQGKIGTIMENGGTCEVHGHKITKMIRMLSIKKIN